MTVAIGVIIPHPAFSQDTVSAIVDCAKIADRDKRLSCYDRRINALVIERQSQPIESKSLAAPPARPPVARPPAARPTTAAVSPAGPTAAVSPTVQGDAVSPSREGEKKSWWARWRSPNRDRDGDRDDDEQIEADTQLSRHTTDNRGKHTFYLANGQVWQQKYAENLTVRDGDPVILKSGFMGRTKIKVGNNSFVRVGRVN